MINKPKHFNSHTMLHCMTNLLYTSVVKNYLSLTCSSKVILCDADLPCDKAHAITLANIMVHKWKLIHLPDLSKLLIGVMCPS